MRHQTIAPGSIRTRYALIFGVTYSLYVLAATLLVAWVDRGVSSLFDLGFYFGPKVARIAQGEGLGDATRLPLIPWMLGVIAAWRDDPLLAALVKNSLLQGLLGYALYRTWRADGWRPGFLVLLCIVGLFPQLLRHSYALIPEEGYLVAMLGYLFYGMIESSRWEHWTRALPCAVVAGLAMLVKSSVVLVVPVMALGFYLRSRRPALAATVAAGALVAALGWGFTNLQTTGEFRIDSSVNGLNFWGGNNSRTLDYFPHKSIDPVSSYAPRHTPGMSEWDWNDHLVRDGIAFNLEHPGTGCRIFLLRLYKAFISVTGEDTASDYAGRDHLKPVGVVWMVLFRVAFFVATLHALHRLWRYWRNRPESASMDADTALALAWLLLVGSFLAPFLAAWIAERHLMPLVIPTVLYLWAVLRRGPAGSIP